MDIKRLQPGDEKIAEQVMEVFFLESQHDHTTAFLSNPLNYLLIAVWEDIPVGVLLGYQLQRPETPRPMFFVYEMEVLEAQRGRGIGRELIKAFKDICKENNGTEIFLVTHRSNIPAMRLYEATGGTPEGEDNVLFVYDNFDE
jgi:ribosomal protein S18 acetylase RimI-like enzyme